MLRSRITHKILAEHADTVSSAFMEPAGEGVIVDERLIDVHAADVAVRVFACVAVGALALADRELHVVQVSASERLGTTRAADGGVNEEVRQMRTLVQ